MEGLQIRVFPAKSHGSKSYPWLFASEKPDYGWVSPLLFEGNHYGHAPAHAGVDLIDQDAGGIGYIAALLEEEIID